ncbi:MAG TPA: pyridoxamine 5'-phosphate oxidase family protein [Acidimicrobiales bacterium]|nr:pyridoxamine 5'-phosphate oxidase family protein [Acidimicrobiales bacterium]
MDRVLTDTEGLEVLVAEQCLELLAGARLGRVAVTVGAVPAIFPVHYRLLDGQVVFRAGDGTDLHAAVADTVVAFEVDDVDPDWTGGWSVLVVGVARDVRDVDAVASALERAPDLWEPGPGAHVIAILPGMVSGRRFSRRSPWPVPTHS